MARFTEEDREDTLALPISAIKDDREQLMRYFEALTLDELWIWTRAFMNVQGDIATVYNRKKSEQMTKGKT